jgi:cobalt-zinc-cadmium efflux system membrane fusion protein
VNLIAPANTKATMTRFTLRTRKPSRRALTTALLAALLVAAAAWTVSKSGGREGDRAEVPAGAKKQNQPFTPNDAQWATLTIEPVGKQVFRSGTVTEGKIAVDEDRATPVFSPYAGRVTRLLARPGDTVAAGQPLFMIEVADMVQAQNDFIAALTGVNKARSQLSVAEIIEKRHRDLYKDKAVALRELEQAQLSLVAAQNDMRAADTALEAVRNRLRILGRSDEDIKGFEQTGRISAETPIAAPIGGTIVQRKVGPGQYINSGATEPVYVVGDLSTVWLVAYVRETVAPKVQADQQIAFTVLAYPDDVFKGNIKYVSATLDPATRRLLVRATILNRSGLLTPEMFANVTIYTDEGDFAPAVPREAVIYEGNTARVWVANNDKSIELRPVKLGVADGRMLQVLAGLQIGEKVVTRGSLFIDRAAVGS